MTAPELAQMLNARKAGRGTWKAKCPAHSDSNPSLTIKEGRKAILICCQSHHCNIADICKAVGIATKDLWYEQNADPRAIREAERKRKAEEWRHRREFRKASAMVERFRLAERKCCRLAMQRKASPKDIRLYAEYHQAVEAALMLLDQVNQTIPFTRWPTMLYIGRIGE